MHTGTCQRNLMSFSKPPTWNLQCAAFIAGMLESGLTQRVLIVAPKTLLLHWEKELTVCGVGRITYGFYGSSESERASSLASVSRRGGVLLTTYGMVQHNAGQLRQAGEARCNGKLVPSTNTSLVAAAAWDMMFLDEVRVTETKTCCHQCNQ